MDLATHLGLTTYTFEVYLYVFTIAAKTEEDAKQCALVKLLDERIIDDASHQFKWVDSKEPNRFYMEEPAEPHFA